MTTLHTAYASRWMPGMVPMDDSVAGIVDPLEEELYWNRYFRSEPYYDPGRTFEEYAPAYRLGIAFRLCCEHCAAWDACEDELREVWERNICNELMAWDEAREPIRAAWMRVQNALCWRH